MSELLWAMSGTRKLHYHSELPRFSIRVIECRTVGPPLKKVSINFSEDHYGADLGPGLNVLTRILIVPLK